jgi:hypothetical protein
LTPCAFSGCVAKWGEHRPHCGAVAPDGSAARGSPCVLPRGHRGPTVHVYGAPGVLDQLTQRDRSVVVKVEPA